MTVTTNNATLFNMYMDALDENDGYENNAWLIFRFWDLYTSEGDSFMEDPSNYHEALKISNAFIEGAEVKLEERTYALRAKNVKDDDGDDIYLANYAGRLGIFAVSKRCSEKQWENLFNRSPYMHREDWEEVEDEA